MHEQGVVRGLIERVEAVVQREGGGAVRVVRVWVGALAHMTESHFLDHFRIESAGTCAEGVQVEVELSADLDDPHAQGVLLRSIDLEEPAGGIESV